MSNNKAGANVNFQQNNQDNSMDDILASIRSIITQKDNGYKGNGLTSNDTKLHENETMDVSKTLLSELEKDHQNHQETKLSDEVKVVNKSVESNLNEKSVDVELNKNQLSQDNNMLSDKKISGSEELEQLYSKIQKQDMQKDKYSSFNNLPPKENSFENMVNKLPEERNIDDKQQSLETHYNKDIQQPKVYQKDIHKQSTNEDIKATSYYQSTDETNKYARNSSSEITDNLEVPIVKPVVFEEIQGKSDQKETISNLIKEKIFYNSEKFKSELSKKNIQVEEEQDQSQDNELKQDALIPEFNKLRGDIPAFLNENSEQQQNIKNKSSENFVEAEKNLQNLPNIDSDAVVTDNIKRHLDELVKKTVEQRLTSDALQKNSFSIAMSADLSLSQIIEKLLQPMLANWLDNNFPLIVERTIEKEVRNILLQLKK